MINRRVLYLIVAATCVGVVSPARAQGVPQEIQALAAQIASLTSEIAGLTAAAGSASKPKFYLTTGNFDGSQVLNACDAGFHTASIWEVLDPSNLRYDTSRGRTTEDSGDGPPRGFGWIRTGTSASSDRDDDLANCEAYTVNGQFGGTAVGLPGSRDQSTSVFAPWVVTNQLCSSTQPVWCVENQQ